MLGRYGCSLKYAQLSFRAANLALIWCIRHMTSSHLWSRQSNDKSDAHRLSMSVDSIMGIKPPSHQPRSHYVLQKLSGRSKNFVQRSRNAVETDKDVICMVCMDVEDVVELWTCSKKRSEDVVESGRSKNLMRT